MTPQAAEQAIQARFMAEWNGHTPIAWDNLDFEVEGRSEPWVRLTVQFTSGTIASLGAPGTRSYRNFGVLIVQVFTLAGSGKADNTELCKRALDVFRGVQLPGGVWFRELGIQHVGPEGRWYQQNVTGQFIYDDHE